jgi:CPA1 family monovalent cation:H+ antiporter
MRGVVSLAAALSLPATLSNGRPFLQRNALIFLTFSAILVTLVLQGLSLPPLIRFLNVCESDEQQAIERRARRKMISAALRRIDELRENDGPKFDSIYDAFARWYQQRLDLLGANGEEESGEDDSAEAKHTRFHSVGRELRDAERAALTDLYSRNEIGAEVLRDLEHDLDLQDIRAAKQ